MRNNRHIYTGHGGNLIDLLLEPEAAEQYQLQAKDMRSIVLNRRQLSDVELLMNGAFSPLAGFMNRSEYESVVDQLRLPDGCLWPIPITLDIDEKTATKIDPGEEIALRDQEGFMVAVLKVEDLWPVDKPREAEFVYRTTHLDHPGVEYLYHRSGDYYIGGKIYGIRFPIHFAYRRHRHSPAEIRRLYKKLGWRRIVGFHTRNPLHRAQTEITMRAMAKAKANLLLHPVMAQVKPGDIDAFTRIRCYIEVTHKYPPNMMLLSLLPLSMRMAGPREALLHAIIRKNYGCTHFVIGRDHGGPGVYNGERRFYGPNEAIEFVKSYEDELKIGIVPFEEMVYVVEDDVHKSVTEVRPDETKRSMSDEEFHRLLRSGKRIPDWFTFPEVVEVLQKAYPPRHKQGFTVFCTGLPGAGKSTVARVLYSRFLEMGGRPVTLLDGDIVRHNLSNELGFSKEHRDINVRRIGFVASEITKNRGIAICAPIAPYARMRRQIRELIENYGGFIEVFVSTPLEICEQRDPKGLYAKARAGLVKGFTGVDDPYEPPAAPEVMVNATDMTPDEAAQEVLLYLEREGYIR